MKIEVPKVNLYFTGWHKSATHRIYAAQYLWKGLATFSSGRVEEVFYKVSITCTDQQYATEAMKDAEKKAHILIDAPIKYGVLSNWKSGRRARPIQKVEWKSWVEL